MTLKKPLKKAVKKAIAKQIGRQVKEILEKNIKFIDPAAADFAERYAQYLAARAMGGHAAPASNTDLKPAPDKSTRVKIKITGMNKVVKDTIHGKSAEQALKDHAGIFASFTFKF